MTDLADACALPVPRLPMADLAPEVDERAKTTGTTALMGQFGHAPGLIESWLAWYQPLMLKRGLSGASTSCSSGSVRQRTQPA